MKYVFTKGCWTLLSIYAVLCINGSLQGPRSPWDVLAVSLPILFVMGIEKEEE